MGGYAPARPRQPGCLRPFSGARQAVARRPWRGACWPPAQIHFALECVSAVPGEVRAVREVVARAEERRAMRRRATIRCIDEIHRSNRAQQNALLAHVETGLFTLLGATNRGSLLSRNCKKLDVSVNCCHQLTPGLSSAPTSIVLAFTPTAISSLTTSIAKWTKKHRVYLITISPRILGKV